jgi:hypothetical protein
MALVGRLFFELSGDTSKRSTSQREAIETAEQAGEWIQSGKKSSMRWSNNSRATKCQRLRRRHPILDQAKMARLQRASKELS